MVRRDWLQLTGPWNCAATRAKGWQLLAHWGRAGGRVGEHTDVGQIAENLVYKFYNLPNWSKLIQIVPFVQHSGSRLIGHWMFQFPIHCFLHSSASLCMFVEEGSDPELNFGDTCSSYIDGLASPLILQCLYKKMRHNARCSVTVVLPGKPGAVESSANPGIGVKIVSQMEHLSWYSMI